MAEDHSGLFVACLSPLLSLPFLPSNKQATRGIMVLASK